MRDLRNQKKRVSKSKGCHSELPARFQRVKRAMNKQQVWCCKQGVAEGMLRASAPLFLVVRAKTSPRCKGMDVANFDQSVPHLRQQGVAGECVDGGGRRQIHAENPILLRAKMKSMQPLPPALAAGR